jgi:2-phospho-L-lactate transferase/gluconeogenesis factor (CofD/UPF0052 family)
MNEQRVGQIHASVCPANSKAKSMKKHVGLWIDHRNTVIVTVTDTGEETKRIASNMEKHVRFSGGAQNDSAEDMQDRRFTGHLSKYYAEVIACLRDAESIFIFGPGEAKVELKKQLESEGLGSHIVATETVDKMTDHQIVAKVRERFPKPN